MAYTKLHQSLVSSTIWREPHPTRIVWITMMAMADKNGEVQASIPGLADICRVTIPECEVALESFLSPDKYSRTKDLEGRRIEEIDGGWSLVNHPKYRALASKEDAKEKASERTARYRRIKASQSTARDGVSTQDRDIADTDTDSDIRLANANRRGAAPPDIASVVFGIGLDWLKQSTGKSDDTCRSLLGKWRKQSGDEALIAALGRAQREGPIDAVAWMEKAMKPPAPEGQKWNL